MDDKVSPGITYSRLVYDSALDWYKSADTKAHIILTLDAVFLAFLTSTIFMKQGELVPIFGEFGWETWLFLVLMCGTLAGSILSAIVCLWSRVLSDKELANRGVNTANPQFMFFFQYISRLDAKRVAQKLAKIDDKFEMEAMAHATRNLSINVMRKHNWANCGFALAGTSLGLFLAVAVSYVARLKGSGA